MYLAQGSFDRIARWALYWGSTEQFHKKCMERPKAIDIYHVANVEEKTELYTKFRVGMEEELNRLKFSNPTNNSKLRSVMGYVSGDYGYPHVNRKEKPISPDEMKTISHVLDRSIGFLFAGTKMKANSGMGHPANRRDFAARAYSVFRYFKEYTHPILSQDMTLRQMHQRLLEEGPFLPITTALSRRQADPYGKERSVHNADGDMVVMKRDIMLFGESLQGCRYRTPQSFDGAGNIPLAILTKGVQHYMDTKYPNLWKHKNPTKHTRRKIEQFVQRARKEHGQSCQFWVKSLDYKHMEMSVPTQLVSMAKRKVDSVLGDYGITYSTLNSVGLSGSGDKLRLHCTHQFEEVHDDLLLGLGNMSGMFSVVVPTGRVAGVAPLLHVLHHRLDNFPLELDEIEHGDRIMVLNSVDDIWMIGALPADHQRLAGYTVNCMNMDLTFDDENTFLKMRYIINDDDTVRVEKDYDSFFNNIFVSEGGLVERFPGYWVRRGNVEKTRPAGLGIISRLLSYSAGGNVLELWHIMKEQLRKHLKMEWWQAWPIDAASFSELLNYINHDDPAAIDAWDMILDIDPDIIYKGWSADDLPEDLLLKHFLYVTPERFEWLTDGKLDVQLDRNTDYDHPFQASLEDAEMEEVRKHLELEFKEVERAKGFIETPLEVVELNYDIAKKREERFLRQNTAIMER